MAKQNGQLYFDNFAEIFDKKFERSKFSIDSKRTVNSDFSRSKSMGLLTRHQNILNQAGMQNQTIVDDIRQLLRISSIDIAQIFQQIDKDQKGILTFIEFRNVLKQLKLGITNKQLDELYKHCDVDNLGYVNWKDFVQKVQIKEISYRILDRSKTRLDQLKADMYSYMISPKEAFRQVNHSFYYATFQFNIEQNGKLTFNQFETLLQKIAEYSHNEHYPYQIVKDLFGLIDIRKDNVIDMKEWLHAFAIPKQLKNIRQNVLADLPIEYKQLTLEQQKLVKLRSLLATSSQQNSPIKLTAQQKKKLSVQPQQAFVNSVNWELSIDYDKVLYMLGKNRKAIQDAFELIIKQDKILTPEKCLKLLKKVVRGLGIDPEKVNWGQLLKIAEKDGFFDYKFFLAILKKRAEQISTHPKIG